MLSDFFYRFTLLFSTSDEIEARPLHRRPRFMAAAWGGLLVCKLAAMSVLGFTEVLPLAIVVVAGGIAAVQVRFRHEHRPEQRVQSWGEALARQAS